jgi:HK97 family phage prohead protease
MEKRTWQASELRASTTGSPKVSGYAARYGVLSHSLGKFKERIAKRAFDKILSSSPDTVLLLNHDQNLICGRTTAGTLQLRSDDNGLRFDCDLPNTSYARDLHENVLAGNLNACSFAFTLDAGDDEWAEEEDENRSRSLVRTIKNFSSLHDVSIVTSPAYPNTSVDARMNVVSAEVRSYVAKVLRVPLSQRFLIGVPQEEIDAMVENRDTDRYPLSGSELRELTELRKRRLAMLEQF